MADAINARMADLTGKTCIVTGCTSGIGTEVARNLAGMNASVILACRNVGRGNAVKDEIARQTGNHNLTVSLLDVASQSSIREFAPLFGQVDVLVNNAAGWFPDRRLSEDRIELTWATNVLGPHLLTYVLADALRAAGHARVVNVVSQLAGGLDLADVEMEHRYEGVAAYRHSKQALRMLTWAFAERFEGEGISVNAVHPGVVRTSIAQKGTGLSGFLYKAFFQVLGQSPEAGADTATWLAASPEVKGVTNRYWEKRRERKCPFRDPHAITQLWEIACRQTGVDSQIR